MRQRIAKRVSRPASPAVATATIVVASIAFGLVPFFARSLTEAGMAAPAIAFYRFGFISLLLLPIGRAGLRKRPAMFWAFGTGLALGLGWIGYVEALKTAPIAAAGVIYMSYPLFALLAAWLLLGQKPAARSIIGGGLILAAAGLALAPGSLGPGAVKALLLSLTAPMSFGAGIAILSGKMHDLNPPERVFFAALGASLGLVPLVVGLPSAALWPQDAGQWLLIFGIAVGTALIPQLLYVMAAPVVGAARTAMAGSFELPTMFLVGWLAFGEAVTPLQMIAGLMVIAAIAVTPPLAPPATLTPAVSEEDEAG